MNRLDLDISPAIAYKLPAWRCEIAKPETVHECGSTPRTADAGEQAGLTCERIIVARCRGDSVQQMRCFGRNPSRESVVVVRKA